MVAQRFLYDGDCAFCSSSARFIERHIPTEALVQPWQFADLDALGLTSEECDRAVQWISTGSAGEPVMAEGPRAIAALLRSSRGRSAWLWRPLGLMLGSRIALVAAWPAYRWVARNRHRLPGGTAACSLPAKDRAKGHDG